MKSVNRIRKRIYFTTFVINFILFLGGLSSPALATDVGGGIHEDTIWTVEGSPYIVISDVILFPGYTLTIEPGVSVQFNPGLNLIIRGTLNAIGTDADRITFTSVSPPDNYGGVQLATNSGGKAVIEFADFSYANTAISVECCWGVEEPANISDSTFRNNRTALGGYAGNNVIVEDCIFENNTYAITRADKVIYNSVFINNTYGLYETERISVYNSSFSGHEVALYGGRGTVEYCTISENDTGVKGFFEGFTLSKNTITNNDIGVVLTGSGDNPPVEFNNIFGNTTYNAKVVGPENRSAQNNWWGTTDPAEIDEKIYDGLDDPMLGLLDYLPFLTEPYEEGPIVTSVAPSSRGQGATGQDIIVTGTNFMDGADVSFSGDGITVNSTTFVSDTELVANIDIASDAPVGFRDVIVTNPDSQTGIGEDIFSVTAAPTVTSTNPDSLPQGSEDQYVMIEGSGFVDNLPDDPNGPQLAADFGDGITVNSVAYFNSTVLIASISIAEDAAVGARDVTVVNGDAGVGVGVGIFTVVEPSELTLVCKTDKEIYNPWESVQVLADVDNPGSSFDANLLGGIIVVRTPPKKPFILKGEVVTETIHPGANPDILLYTSKPIITAIAPKVTHGAFSVLYTQEDGILAIDTSTWGLTAPPDVAQEKFFDKLIRSYIDKYGVENLQNANAEEALASPANAPSQTALGSAFPNSANPETWFPFQLSEPSEVTIEIYNASGQLVKTLDFGYKEAGYYLNKEKAAFWNGRNDRGERVASGIYFYTMQTRNFTATKKVVILK